MIDICKNEIKSILTPEDVAVYYGIKVSKKHKALCPFHKDTNPSLSFKDDVFNCFRCGEKGDVFSFIQKYKNLSFVDALKEAGRIAGVNCEFNSSYRDNKTTTQKQPSNQSEQSLKIYKKFFSILGFPENCKQYLINERRLTAETIDKAQIRGIGSKTDAIRIKTQLEKEFNQDELINSGLFTEKGLVWYRPTIIFPYFENGDPVYFSNRYIDEIAQKDKKQRYRLMTGQKQRYSWNTNQNKLYVFEGVIDALSYYQMTGNDNFIALNQIIDQGNINDILNLYNSELTLVFDNDNAGREAKGKTEYNKRISFFIWESFLKSNKFMEEIKDFNDVLKNGVHRAMETQKVSSSGTIRQLNFKNGLEECHFISKLITDLNNFAILTIDQIRYLKSIYGRYIDVLFYKDCALSELVNILTEKYEKLQVRL